MFKFSDYLNICREAKQATQNELVDELIALDSSFKFLDTTTLSRWERGVSKPSMGKQVLILRYFSTYYGRIYPFIETAERIDIVKSFCAIGFAGLVGRHKALVMNFPTHQMNKAEFNICEFNESQHKSAAISNNRHLYIELYKDHLCAEQQELFADNINNLFLVCDHNDQYFGHFFTLRLKTDVFDDVINFRRTDRSLTNDDIAGADEVGSYYFYGLFAMSNQVISLFYVHFYSYLIQKQECIDELGVIAASKDGKMMARNMNMECVALQETKTQVNHSFRASLEDILINDNVVKMLFNPENCSEQ